MTTTPTESARKAREALGLRLREIRKDAGLTGRALACATGWHFTRVSKLEHGSKAPSDADIRAWCAACGVEPLVPDLIAQARAVESMYLEFKRQARSGLKHVMRSTVPLYERTTNFRIYEHNVIPGLFQTAEYARAMLSFWIDFLETANDLDAAVAANLERQQALYQPSKRFAVVLEEAALRTWFGTAETMAGQLDRLLTVMTLPNVALSVVPMMVERQAVGSTGFWIFDDDFVSLETPSASIEVTAPQEVALYTRMFDRLREPAVYGPDVRHLIVRAMDDLQVGN